MFAHRLEPGTVEAPPAPAAVSQVLLWFRRWPGVDDTTSARPGPTLPPPPGSTPAVPLPPPPLSAPSVRDAPPAPAPSPGLPTLPTAGPTPHPTRSVDTTPRDASVAVHGHVDGSSGSSGSASDSDAGADAVAVAAEPGPSGRRRREIPIGWVLAAAAATIVGTSAFVVLQSDVDMVELADPAPVVGVRDEPAPDDAPDEGGSGAAAIDAIDDARDVVGRIDANDGEEELLAELGLGPTGEPIEVPADGAAGYHFTWIDPSGQVLDVVVDGATGDYSVDASDGISFRLVGDEFFGRRAPDADWFALADDPFDSIPVVGLDGVPTVASILPPVTAGFVISDTTDGSVRTVVVDDAALAGFDLGARNAWLRPWGLLDDSGEAATDVVVRITADPSGTGVVGASIDAPVLGGVAAFSIEDVFSIAPTIEVPTLGS